LLVTPLGKIALYIDKKEADYTAASWEKDKMCSGLDGRYLLRIRFVPDGREHTISCRIQDYLPSPEDGIESGKRLSLKSFYKNGAKLSIGAKGESDYLWNKIRVSEFDYDTDYLEDGVCYVVLKTTKTTDYIFGLAWLCNYTEKNEVQTWCGADVSLIRE